MNKKIIVLIIGILFFITVAAIVLLATAGVFSGNGSRVKENQARKTNYNNEAGKKNKTDRKVYMMGRSVMDGWFEYWGSDDSKPVNRDGFSLIYQELETPPDIADSAKDYIDEISDENAVVFFKFCFDDFWAESKDDISDNLEENENYIKEVYKYISQNGGYPLIIGNALPKVKDDTNPYLVRAERDYNIWLESFARRHQGEIYIFDQYSVLADDKGRLKKEFASDESDSHPNEDAYKALDKPFLNLLSKNLK